MKIFIPFFLLFFGLACAQEKNSIISAEAKFATASGMGNKFFRKSFKTAPGVGVAVNIKTIERLYAVLDFKAFFPAVKDPVVYGDFTSVEMINYSIGAKYLFPINPKLDAEGKILVGGLNITGHVSGYDSDYVQRGWQFSGSGNLVYHVGDRGIFSLVGGLGAQRLFSSINIDNDYFEEYYNNSWLLMPELGFRFNF